jgi:hypothetical protein
VNVLCGGNNGVDVATTAEGGAMITFRNEAIPREKGTLQVLLGKSTA